MSRRRVLLTGAAGWVASRMLDDLRQRYDLVLTDLRTTNRAGDEVPGVQLADLLDRDRDTYRHLFAGCDAVIHCAFRGGGPPDERYWVERDNVDLAHNVFQTAVEEGVRRVAVASSNHGGNFYEGLIHAGHLDMVTPDMPPRARDYYGWAKGAYECLGFTFAAGVGGRPLENVHIRIGGPRETDPGNCEVGDRRALRRALAVYLSARDQAQLFIKAVEAEDIRDEHGVPFQIVYGISGNAHRFWSLANARRILGYDPEDDSQELFAADIRRVLGTSDA